MPQRGSRIPQAEITGFSGAVVKRMARKMLGKVPESLGVMWLHRGRNAKAWDRGDESLEAFAHMSGIEAHGLAAACNLPPLRSPTQEVRSPA